MEDDIIKKNKSIIKKFFIIALSALFILGGLNFLRDGLFGHVAALLSAYGIPSLILIYYYINVASFPNNQKVSQAFHRASVINVKSVSVLLLLLMVQSAEMFYELVIRGLDAGAMFPLSLLLAFVAYIPALIVSAVLLYTNHIVNKELSKIENEKISSLNHSAEGVIQDKSNKEVNIVKIAILLCLVVFGLYDIIRSVFMLRSDFISSSVSGWYVLILIAIFMLYTLYIVYFSLRRRTLVLSVVKAYRYLQYALCVYVFILIVNIVARVVEGYEDFISPLNAATAIVLAILLLISIYFFVDES